MAILARDKGFNGLILPRENAPEAAVVEEIEVIGIGTLAEAVGFVTGQLPLEPTGIDIDAVFADASRYEEDFSEVLGQESVKRAVTVAAADGHNILLTGPIRVLLSAEAGHRFAPSGGKRKLPVIYRYTYCPQGHRLMPKTVGSWALAETGRIRTSNEHEMCLAQRCSPQLSQECAFRKI
jgi:hypothetical protein